MYTEAETSGRTLHTHQIWRNRVVGHSSPRWMDFRDQWKLTAHCSEKLAFHWSSCQVQNVPFTKVILLCLLTTKVSWKLISMLWLATTGS